MMMMSNGGRKPRHRRGRGKGRGSNESIPPTPSTQEPALSTPASSGDASSSGGDVENTSEHDKEYCSEIAVLLEDGTELERAAAFLKGSVLHLSFHSNASSRLVQKGLERLSSAVAAELAEELQGHVVEAILDKNANYVIQQIVAVLPADCHGVAFVIKELLDCVCGIARHRYGCRIIQRLIEHSDSLSTSEEFAELMRKIIKDVKGLSRSVYGHHVVTTLLENGTEQQKVRVGDIICTHFDSLAQCRYGRDVMLNALRLCSAKHQQSIAHNVFRDNCRVLTLAQSKNGHQLIEAALNGNVGDEWTRHMWLQQLKTIAPELMISLAAGNKHGKPVLALLDNRQ